MTAQELRRLYLDFFVKNGHSEVKSAALIPENDPTVLFTTAGMHPLVPFLLGEQHPGGKRLTSCQKCIRTQDIDEVGDETHLTFFEMLGNWSLGDYFKKEAIAWSYEFLTKVLKFKQVDLAVTVFAGDADAPFDEEAYKLWQGHGFPPERIAKLPKSDNWWGPAGVTGPCGPDTEMFYWTGEGQAPKEFDPQDKRWVEIWNDVFMQYFKDKDGKFTPLKQQNVDTGMGLERTLTVLSGKKSVYDTVLFTNILAKIEELSNKESVQKNLKSMRIIADHLRAGVFILAEQIKPSNVDQGYVLRRLIRRAVRHGRKLGINQAFTHLVAKVVIEDYAEAYPELKSKQDFILQALVNEEDKFAKTLENGLKEFEKLRGHLQGELIAGQDAFHLYDTYGFPIEFTEELAKENNLKVDLAAFEQAFKCHQDLSRQGAEQKFKGGLQDHSEETTALHTATHLLHQALRQVLGTHVEQRGSNITAERLRFDFSHPDKMTAEQLQEVEKIVNEVIKADLPIICEVKTVDEAKAEGSIGLFESKYGEKVKVYTVQNPKDARGFYSKEICGGPHVSHTGELGTFKIQKEESSSAGIRRIKATLGTR